MGAGGGAARPRGGGVCRGGDGGVDRALAGGEGGGAGGGVALGGCEMGAWTARWPGAMVRVPEGLERRLWSPDPNDVHVLAAAAAGAADATPTAHAKAFPGGRLGGGGT